MSEDAVTLAGLPEEVRGRVVALTADVLPAVPKLPPPVRKVADFAPSRRARLGGGLIAATLEADAEFRDRVAVQVAAQVAARPAAQSAEDPVGAAAVLWLTRPEGWSSQVADLVRRLPDPADRAPSDAAALERLQAKLAETEQTARDAKGHHRAELTELKSENAALRRKLGDARADLKEAKAAAGAGAREVEEVRRAAQADAAAQEKEIRSLRARMSRLDAEAAAGRREARAEKDDAGIRARLLLDAVIDAASGLRRELALPPVTGEPGDRVEADLAEAGVRTPSSAGALGPGSPALLDHYLSLPRARLIIDGYNVSKSAWSSSSLEAQRTRLLNALAPLVARTGAVTTVVFDAAATSVRPVVNAPRGVKVLFSPEQVIADDVIRDLVDAEPTGRVVVVVTSDRALAADVGASGAKAVAADALIGLLGRSA